MKSVVIAVLTTSDIEDYFILGKQDDELRRQFKLEFPVYIEIRYDSNSNTILYLTYLWNGSHKIIYIFCPLIAAHKCKTSLYLLKIANTIIYFSNEKQEPPSYCSICCSREYLVWISGFGHTNLAVTSELTDILAHKVDFDSLYGQF